MRAVQNGFVFLVFWNENAIISFVFRQIEIFEMGSFGNFNLTRRPDPPSQCFGAASPGTRSFDPTRRLDPPSRGFRLRRGQTRNSEWGLFTGGNRGHGESWRGPGFDTL
jgi:hypothetical protein